MRLSLKGENSRPKGEGSLLGKRGKRVLKGKKIQIYFEGQSGKPPGKGDPISRQGNGSCGKKATEPLRARGEDKALEG